VENARRLLDALDEAKLGTASLIDVDTLLANEITVFKGVVRINVQNSTPGLAFADAWRNRKTVDYQGQSLFVVSKQDLIAAKRAAGRAIDLADVRLLELDPRSDDPA